jgi:heptosyltransferase-2
LLSLADPARAVALASTRPRPRLYPTAADRDAAHELLQAAGAARNRRVALAPGSIWGTKRWPGYAALAALIAPDARPVIVGSADDASLAAEIVAASAGAAVDATGKLTLLQSAALIARCSALVCNDSAPLHLASAMDTPTVAIFGPTVPEFGFAPLASRSFVAGRSGLPCRPCDRHGPITCPLGHWRCMREVTPAAVLDLLHEATAQI